jgi:hypothetical protein
VIWSPLLPSPFGNNHPRVITVFNRAWEPGPQAALVSVSTIYGTMPSRNWLNPRRATGRLCQLLVTSVSKCWLTIPTVRIETNRKALDGLAVGVKAVGYDTNNDIKSQEAAILS